LFVAADDSADSKTSKSTGIFKGSTNLHEELGYPMVRIKAGRFTMGSYSGDRGRDGDEKLHSVTLTRDYWVGKTEVTQALYQEIMKSNPSETYGMSLPVHKVSWFDAARFCNAMSTRAGLTPAYTMSSGGYAYNPTANGYRLLTEAEWEYAARAGVPNNGSSALYPGSYSVTEVAWMKDNSGRRPHQVGTLRANAWGLHDMAGNVYEWVWDWHPCISNSDFCPYGDGYDQSVDPTGPPGGEERIYRGGSYRSSSSSVRMANRGFYKPDSEDKKVGFRIARSAD